MLPTNCDSRRTPSMRLGVFWRERRLTTNTHRRAHRTKFEKQLIANALGHLFTESGRNVVHQQKESRNFNRFEISVLFNCSLPNLPLI